MYVWLITPPGNTPSKLSLVSSWHITDAQNDIFTKKWKKQYCSAILILPVTLAPPTGFHASKRRGLRAMKNFSSLASDFNHSMNYCFQILESISLAICFLSCFSVNACRSNRARVSASSSLLLAWGGLFAWAWDTLVTCSKHSPGGHVYCELITEKFLYLSFR